MLIRNETANDHDAIRAVHIAAFADHPYSHQTEHLIVDALRAANSLTASLVAEIDGLVAGHIAFSPLSINGASCDWSGVGPVGVLPPLQRQGIGRALVEHGLQALRDRGAAGCVLVGDPAFYRRFRFRQAAPLTLEGVPPEYLLCLPMAGPIPAGVVTFHAAYSVST